MPINRSPRIQYATGFNCQAGQTSNITIPNGGAANDRRFHRLKFKCQAINYTGGNGLTTTKLTGNGNNDCKTNLTVVNGVVTAAAVAAAGTGYVTGDTITPNDATGNGCVLTVTANAGAVTALAVTVGGTPSPIDPSAFFDSIQIGPGSLRMRDISPKSILRMLTGRGIKTSLGELPIYFTEVDRNFLLVNDATSWDMHGLKALQILAAVNKNVQTPSFSLMQEFDNFNNQTVDQKGKTVVAPPNPIKWREFQNNQPQGQSDIINLPIDEAIQRMWIYGSVPGALTNLQIIADGDVKLEGTVDEINRMYQDFGFAFGRADYLNRNIASNQALSQQFNPLYYPETAYLPDRDGRLTDLLNIGSELKVRVTNSQAQTVNIIMETAPGAWK